MDALELWHTELEFVVLFIHPDLLPLQLAAQLQLNVLICTCYDYLSQ